MKYPELVPKRLCKTPIHVKLESEGNTNLGEPEYILEADLLCNYQDSAKRILTEEKRLVQVSGSALFHGDIVPDIPAMPGGTATVFGVERRIVQGQKARNPDGTVNYCCLELE